MSKFVLIGQRLKEERDRLGLSQVDFASLGGAGRKTQYNYEAGERAPDGGYLAAIAEHGADVAYILTGVRTVAASGPVNQDPLSPRAHALMENYQGCSEEDQRAIERMALLSAEAKQKDLAPARQKKAG